MLRAFLLVLAIDMVIGCRRSAAEDMVIQRDGKTTRGDLAGCAGDNCTMNGTPIARSTIVLIGLNLGRLSPKIQDALHDQVQLTDASVVAATMTGIDAGSVVTEKDSYPRERVAWIYLAPKLPAGAQGASSSSGAEGKSGITYEWAGTINIENKYDGSEGHHRWQATYTVRFLEVATDSTAPGDAGKSFHENGFVPVAFAYEMQADQTWDKHVYSPNSVTMSGHAGGELTAEVAQRKKVLRGELIRIDGPAPAGAPPATSFDSEQEYYRSLDNVDRPSAPGWFDISITFITFIDHDSYRDIRALYGGIERGGQAPPFFADPDHDVLHWVPAWMPEGTVVIGRLDSPDQRQVQGSATFPRQGPGNGQDREQVTVTWAFQRTRQERRRPAVTWLSSAGPRPRRRRTWRPRSPA